MTTPQKNGLYIQKREEVYCSIDNQNCEWKKTKMMKTKEKKTVGLLSLLMAFVFSLCLAGCGSDDYEFLKDPRLRVLGTWKQTLRFGNDVSSKNIYYKFSSDGKVWIKTNEGNEGWERVKGKETFGFYDGWTYDEKTDEISGRIYFTYTYYTDSGSTEVGKSDSYKCIIGRKEMRWYGDSEFLGVADNRHVFER